MLNILQHAHSGTRWLVLVALVTAIVFSYRAMKGGKWSKGPVLAGLVLTHIQFVIGLILYFISPYVQFTAETMKDTLTRFYTVEHISLMVIAIVLITIGYSKAKRQNANQQKGKTVFRFYLIGLILMLVSIPWPFRNLGAGWF